MPHSHRHVLGWNRILTELQECGVHAICVFDGHERSGAKAREVSLAYACSGCKTELWQVARRREIRRMDSARGHLEMSRLTRLKRLLRLLAHYRLLPASDRQCIINTLKETAVSPLPSADANDDVQHYIDSWRLASNKMRGGTHDAPVWPTSPGYLEQPRKPSEPQCHSLGGFTERDLSKALQTTAQESLRFAHQHVVPEVWRNEVEDGENWLPSTQPSQFRPPFDDPVAALPTVYWGAVEQDEASPDIPSIHMEPCSPSENIRSAFSALYSEYRRSLVQLTSTPSPLDAPLMPGFIPQPMEARVAYAMSKSQLQMMMDEGQIWHSFATSSDGSLPPEMEETLVSLTNKSCDISLSYHRRTNYPSTETYEECKEIISARGVACIEASHPFEAEALASSLVINGQADFVASEDTDVLAYEAPLIRNIANRDDPLIIISGSEVRKCLKLDRLRYIDFALLLGTDFSQRIKNIGPYRALRLIRKYGSIENVVEHESRYPPRIPIAAYLAQVEVARKIFQTLPPIPAPELLRPAQADPAALFHIAQKYHIHSLLPENGSYQAAALAGNYFGDDPCVNVNYT